jgi:hypothetical protein
MHCSPSKVGVVFLFPHANKQHCVSAVTFWLWHVSKQMSSTKTNGIRQSSTLIKALQSLE